MREQLDWEIPIDQAMYKHVAECIEATNIEGVEPEKFVATYRMTFKPGYPDHPTGGVFFDGHYGEEGDMVLIVERKP